MASPFRSAVDLLTQYARYHRDRRNIATHLIGVPLIVLALGVLLSRPAFQLGGWMLSPAWVLFALVAAWYLTRGQVLLGLAVTAGVAALLMIGQRVAGAGVGPWLGWSLGLFVFGMLVQFAGHYYEGRRPAFLDDAVVLLVGPMFVAMELLSPTGLVRGLIAEVETGAGPTRLRNLAHPA